MDLILPASELMSGLHKCLIPQACEWEVNFQQWVRDQAWWAKPSLVYKQFHIWNTHWLISLIFFFLCTLYFQSVTTECEQFYHEDRTVQHRTLEVSTEILIINIVHNNLILKKLKKRKSILDTHGVQDVL